MTGDRRSPSSRSLPRGKAAQSVAGFCNGTLSWCSFSVKSLRARKLGVWADCTQQYMMFGV